jgi:diguanylate cyclase (GGDEF)-like protein/PAS domain S-box-containing protein
VRGSRVREEAAAGSREGARGWSRAIGIDVEPGRFFEGPDVAWRIAPFVVAGLLPFALVPVADLSYADVRVAIAAAMVPLVIGLALLVPWERLPAWPQAIPPLTYFVILALLREAGGGEPSVFDPLLSIPVAWFALYGTGRELAASIVAMGLALLLPAILAGHSANDHEQIVRVIVAMGLAATVGPAVHLLVRALRRSTRDSRSIIETSQEAFISIDQDGRITEWNQQAERLFGWPREELIGRPVADTIVPPRDREAHLKGLEHFTETGEGPMLGRRIELDGRRRDGSEVPIEITIAPLRDGNRWRFNAFLHDISDRRGAEEALREAEERFRLAFDENRVGMAIVALDGSFQRVNRSLCEITGYPPNKLVGKRFSEITHPDDLEADMQALREIVEGERYGYRREKRYIHAQGHQVWISLNVSPIYDSDGIVSYLIGQMEDISERKESEERLTRQALHDSLTGLPNRTLFSDRARMAAARRSGRGFAIVYLDLDGFKLVNDTLGHAAGDQVLIEVARRLERLLRAGDTLARLGGDEFALLCEEVGEAEVRAIADRVIDAMAGEIVVQDRQLTQAASIGIALYGPGGALVDPEQMVGEADLAMYRAKAAGKSRYALFESWMRQGDIDRTGLERELRSAIEGDEIVVHYQPEVDLTSGAITGAEALIRWRHPDRGLLEPAQFLFLAEASDLISDLDDLVLREACRQAAIWRRDMPDSEEFTVSVNVSERRLSDPGLSGKIAQAIADTKLPASSLCLEIAERAVMDQRATALSAIPDLEQLGIRLLIDDFGIAISSFGSLKRLPRLNAIKIDASFIAGLGRSREDSAGVAAIVGLAHGLSLTATAEGVEREEQLRELQALHCDRGQGYYFARPQAPEGLGKLLKSARLGELIS